jgi:hypothetical protein
MSKDNTLKIKPTNFGIAVGAVWGFFTLFGAWVAMFGWSTDFVGTMASTYPGYAASFVGGIIGAVWGFIHGFIKGYLVAYVYNFCCCKK